MVHDTWLNDPYTPDQGTDDDGNVIYGYNSQISSKLFKDGHLVIAGYGRMKDFTQCPFPNPDAITSVTILDTDPENGLYIENIGAHLFDGCTNLTSLYSDNEGKVEGQQISFPSTMSEIGTFAFNNCTGLEGIVIPDTCNTQDKNILQERPPALYTPIWSANI